MWKLARLYGTTELQRSLGKYKHFGSYSFCTLNNPYPTNLALTAFKISCQMIHGIVNLWRPFTLLVNARLPFISVDLWYKRLPNQYSCLAIGHFLASLFCDSWTDSNLRLFIETEPNKTFIYTKMETCKNLAKTNLGSLGGDSQNIWGKFEIFFCNFGP